ncbi:TPA: SGNH hydrolase domain-containing protein [Raoultella ornithinolytica]
MFRYEDYLCNHNVCSMIYDKHPISFDDNHLSLSVARLMAIHIKKKI